MNPLFQNLWQEFLRSSAAIKPEIEERIADNIQWADDTTIALILRNSIVVTRRLYDRSMREALARLLLSKHETELERLRDALSACAEESDIRNVRGIVQRALGGPNVQSEPPHE